MTRHHIAAPRTPAPGDTSCPASEPPGLTTYSAALAQWKSRPAADAAEPGLAEDDPAAAGPRLLYDQALPVAPPGLPALPVLQDIAHAAADRARRLLSGTPLPTTPVADAVHIADIASLTDPTPAYRLNLDLGHWRELLALHRAHGCTGPTTQAPETPQTG